MDYFPFFARLNGLSCLVAGGGAVAARKARQLMRAGARVTVCAPATGAELQALRQEFPQQLTLLEQRFSAALLDDAQFVIAATDDESVNASVARAAAERGLFCNVVDDTRLSSAILPAVVDRSPVIVAVSSGGNSPVLATRIRRRIDAMLAPATGKLAELLGEYRPKVIARFATVDARRAFWQRVLDGPVAGLLLENRHAEARAQFDAMLAEAATMPGMVWIVGAGPGDPELLTLKASRILGTADVIVYDRLVAPDILEYARKDAEFVYVGKQAGQPSTPQEDINTLLIDFARDGKQVCRLKGGDPFIFGRGGEEAEALTAAGIAWQVVPGITAASGCAATAGVPLTHRAVARSVTFTTGRTQDDEAPDWNSLSSAGQTVVLYMSLAGLRDACAALVAAGRDPATPAMVIENGTTPQHREVRGTLANLADEVRAAEIVSPALVIVGETVALPAAVPQQLTPGATRTGYEPGRKSNERD